MSIQKKFKGPVTGKIYNLEHGDKIDPEKEGIGMSGAGNYPSALVKGKKNTLGYSSVLKPRLRPSCVPLYRTVRILPVGYR